MRLGRDHVRFRKIRILFQSHLGIVNGRFEVNVSTLTPQTPLVEMVLADKRQRPRPVGIQGCRLFQQSFRLLCVRIVQIAQQIRGAEHEIVGLRRGSFRRLFRAGQLHAQGGKNALAYLVLEGEDVAHLALVAFGPELS